MNLRFKVNASYNDDGTRNYNLIRPIITYSGMQILFDTGAMVPVWCTGKKSFLERFPNAQKLNYRCFLGGFGRTEREVEEFLRNPSSKNVGDFLTEVYSIPNFGISVEDAEII